MEAVEGKQYRRAGYSLKTVGPSQLMWAHSHVMWADGKLQSESLFLNTSLFYIALPTH